jgi:hypothetical protein
LAPVNRTGCILSASFIPEGEFVIADVRDEVMTHFDHRDEQRHLLIVAERYLVSSDTLQYLAFGLQNLFANSFLGCRALS